MSAPKLTETLNLIFLHGIHLGSPRWLWNSRYYIPSRKRTKKSVSSVVQSCLTLLRPHGLQHTRVPCPSPTPGAYSNSCPSSWWYHPNISSSVVPFFSCLQSFPASGSFPMSQFFASGGQSIEFQLQHQHWKHSPSSEYSWLVFFRIDWLDLLAVQETLKSSPTPQFKSINSLVLSFLYSHTSQRSQSA